MPPTTPYNLTSTPLAGYDSSFAFPSHQSSSALGWTQRDVNNALTPNPTQRVTLIVAACYIVVIAILPFLNKIIYPFKLLTVGMHEMCHAIMGVLTCATVESIQLDPDEGGSTRMRGGVPALTLPAGYLGSSAIGASLIACGFDTNASKVACLFLAFGFIIVLWWARKSWISYLTIAFMAALIILCWLVASSVALRFLVLFIGVMSCFYCMWDIVDDTIARKVNSSDASEFAMICGCCGSRVWGVLWLFNSVLFFAAGILIGLAAFKEDWADQKSDAAGFLGGTPWNHA